MVRVDLCRLGRSAALGLALLVVLGAGAAHAERVRTTGTTKVYKSTGERSGVVTKVASGKTLAVLNTQGRWLKVRVNGRTGWVTRSSVQTLAESDVPRNTRRRPFVDGRSTRRGWGDGAPDDRVGADAVDPGDDGGDDSPPDDVAEGGDDDGGDDRGDSGDEGDEGDDAAEEPADEVAIVVVTAAKAKLYPRASRKAKASRTLRRGAKLTVLDTQGDWIRVELGDDAGWVQADAVTAESAVRPGRVIAATARLGLANVGGTFRSNGTDAAAGGLPANYQLGSNAVSLTVGVEAVFAYKRDYFLGGGLEYLGCIAAPGIRFGGADIGFKTHDVDLRVIGGYDFHDRRGMTLWGRLGYHLGYFLVNDLMNPAELPSESFSGPTFGVGLKIPRVTPTIGASGSLDLVYPGSRTQTENREDGDSLSAMAATLSLVADYAWKPEWTFQGAYRLGYAKSSWTGPSMRIDGATRASRTDLSHVVTVGVGRAF